MADDPSKSFRYDAWLAAYPLNETSVLAYFEHSPFYDRGCINEQIKAQGLTPAAAAHLVGIEYVVRRTGFEPRLFLIERRERRGSGESTVPNAFWAVVEGTVFPTPDLGTLISGRVARAAHHLSMAASLIEQAQAASRASAHEESAADINMGPTAGVNAQLAHQVDAILNGLAGK